MEYTSIRFALTYRISYMYDGKIEITKSRRIRKALEKQFHEHFEKVITAFVRSRM